MLTIKEVHRRLMAEGINGCPRTHRALLERLRQRVGAPVKSVGKKKGRGGLSTLWDYDRVKAHLNAEPRRNRRFWELKPFLIKLTYYVEFFHPGDSRWRTWSLRTRDARAAAVRCLKLQVVQRQFRNPDDHARLAADEEIAALFKSWKEVRKPKVTHKFYRGRWHLYFTDSTGPKPRRVTLKFSALRDESADRTAAECAAEYIDNINGRRENFTTMQHARHSMLSLNSDAMINFCTSPAKPATALPEPAPTPATWDVPGLPDPIRELAKFLIERGGSASTECIYKKFERYPASIIAPTRYPHWRGYIGKHFKTKGRVWLFTVQLPMKMTVQ